MKRRHFLASLALCLAGTAHAAAPYPDGTVTMVVPFPPGGSTDYAGRLVASILADELGGSFVVDNRSGATGSIGATRVARSKPDGYTLMTSSLAVFVVNPHLMSTLAYDPLRDLDPISVIVQAPNVLVAHPGTPANNVAELVALLKRQPNQLTFASSGSGASDHLTAELFWQETKTKAVHVPYKGGAPAMLDLIGGQVDASFANINTILTNVNSGKLRALAVTSEKRQALMPDVPTVAESGVPELADFESTLTYGILAPKGVPEADVAKLSEEILKAASTEAFQSKLGVDGAVPLLGDAKAYASRIELESRKWGEVVKTSGAAV